MFGRTKRDGGEPSAGDPSPASVPLVDLVVGICRAVFAGAGHVRAQHIEAAADFYDRHEGDTAAQRPDTLTPRTVLMQIPAFNPTRAQGEELPVEVPLAALVQHNPFVIDEASFELDCTIDRVLEPAKDGALSIGIVLDRPAKGTPMRLKVRMRLADLPEGMSRVNDALMRGLQ